MAGVAFLNVLGAVSGALGIIQFGLDNFPEPETTGSSIRIAVGLDFEGGLTNAGGDAPDIRLWNEAGEFLGIRADPGKVNHGGFIDFKVDHKRDSSQQATYAVVAGNNNAVCIAYMSITWPDGEKYSWTGDWAELCEPYLEERAPWYNSNVLIGGTKHKPRCMWVDKDGNQPTTGFQVHFPEFVEQTDRTSFTDEEKEDIVRYTCSNGVPFRTFQEPDPRTVTYRVLNPLLKRDEQAVTVAQSTAPAKRKTWTPRGTSFSTRQETSPIKTMQFNQLVVDDSPDNSAFRLCNSASSLGPDFVSIPEGMFCRMSDKSLWPLCTEGLIDACFNMDVKQLIIGGVAARASYDEVMDWGSGN
ncbi:hypothetical protein B0I35DRAFT_437399 [Stachybotrys elegans]|uniref:Uncharacterized protein n=1 Tax=Stachybotrys elegans TaxID=80388 RepID=A0A8K0SMW5_9HYPO|nr:hypothetical protein B0I35DRAFT_437399 [Stachybotrys elegans]